MNWSSIEQNWKQVRLNVKAKWEKLSDEDLDAINGRRERLEKRFRRVTALPQSTSAKKWITGSAGNMQGRQSLAPPDTHFGLR